MPALLPFFNAIFAAFGFVAGWSGCTSQPVKLDSPTLAAADSLPPLVSKNELAFHYIVPHEVRVGQYFQFVDSLVARLDTLVAYDLDGILLARTNPWLIDSFVETDYYRRTARGEFVFDQKKMPILRAGDTLRVPSDSLAAQIRQQQAATWLDLNIPEFRLRIVEGDADTLFSIPVRVGQNRRRHLETIGRIEDLRTKTGTGKIIRVNRFPAWIDPVTGKKYKDTGRDDGRRTKLPQIPWLEPAINGKRWGQMIHPTTNPASLNKAYSNGCIGTSEADAWRIYFYAPIGTKVVFRYQLQVILPAGDTILLHDVYDKKGFRLRN